MNKIIALKKDSKINNQFWQTIKNGDTAEIREIFEQHRNYLIKINGISQIAWHFIFLGLDEFAYSLLKKNSKDEQNLSLLCEIYFNTFWGCLEKVESKLKKLSSEIQSTHKACVYTITQRQEDAMLLLSQLANESLLELPKENLFYIIVALIKDGQYERARFLLTSEATSNSYLNRYYQYCLLYIDYKEGKTSKNEYEISLHSLIHENEKDLINYYIYNSLGELAYEDKAFDKARKAYQLSLQSVPPFYRILQKNAYRILWELNAPLSLEEQLTGIFSKVAKPLAKNTVWLNNEGQFQTGSYHPNSLEGDYVDLVAGQLSFKGKKTWLTGLQAHTLISIIKSGKTGIQISSICEEIHFLNPTEKSIEAVISKLKYEELKISRSNNTISLTLSSNITYMIPHNHRCYGILAHLQFKDFFKRTDIEELANLKKTVAAELIKGWLTQEIVMKRPDISPYAYSLKSLPEK